MSDHGTAPTSPNDRWLQDVRWEAVDKNTIRVCLDDELLVLTDDTQVEQSAGSGWVTVRRRDGMLYVDHRRVVLHCTDRQLEDRGINGRRLLFHLTHTPTLHPNIIKALLANTDLIPDSWKGDPEQGCGPQIYFFGKVYRGVSIGRLFVLYLFWYQDEWHCFTKWLDNNTWTDQDPVAALL